MSDQPDLAISIISLFVGFFIACWLLRFLILGAGVMYHGAIKRGGSWPLLFFIGWLAAGSLMALVAMVLGWQKHNDERSRQRILKKMRSYSAASKSRGSRS